MNAEPQRTPYLIPLALPQPQSQTVTGGLGFMPTNAPPVPIPGEPPNDDLWKTTLEYMDTFSVSQDNAPNNYLYGMEPLNYNGGEQSLTYGEARPIWLLPARASVYANVVPKLIFQAVKVPTAPCQIMFVYVPLAQPQGTTASNLFANKNSFPISSFPTGFADEIANKSRYTKWVWDLSASDTFSIDFTGFVTETTRPMHFPTFVPQNIIGMTRSGVARAALPYENYSVGRLAIFLHQPYMPGSIFPTSFDINIYKCFTKMETLIYRSVGNDVQAGGVTSVLPFTI